MCAKTATTVMRNSNLTYSFKIDFILEDLKIHKYKYKSLIYTRNKLQY